MIPVLFERSESQFRNYGLGEVYFTRAEVTRALNDEYTFYGEYPIDGKMANELIEERWLKVDAGVRTKWQTFQIDRVNKESDDIIRVYATHISGLTAKMSIPPILALSGDANTALSMLMANAIGGIKFDTWSDIDLTSKTTLTTNTCKSVRQALGGVSGSILDTWGGEYEFDNTLIRLHKQLGRNAPTVIEYGRNIISAEVDTQIQNTVTSIVPYANYYDEQGEEHTVWLTELVIHGKHRDKWQYDRVEPIDFTTDFKPDEKPTQEKLRTLANRYVERNNIGVPRTKITLEYIDLSKTLEYKQFKVMEEIELADRVPIYYHRLGITDNQAKVTKVVYNVLIDSNKSIGVGVIGQTLTSKLRQELSDSYARLDNKTNAVSNSLPYLINSLGNRIWYVEPDPNVEHKVGDTWFEKNGKYDRIYKWNGEDWIVEIDTEIFQREIDRKFSNLESSLQSAQEDINEAKQDLLNIELLPGDSAYQIAVKHGFNGTEAEWLKSLEPAPPIQGPAGTDGKTLYTWVKYADNDKGLNMSDYPTATTQYIGIATNKETQAESTDYADYQWTKIKGDQGVQGKDGSNGKTLYTWIKYADTETGQGMSDDPTGKKYIGFAYNKATPTKSSNPADYQWSAMYDMDALTDIELRLDELSEQAELMVSVTGNDKEMIFSDNRLDTDINGDDWMLSLEEGTRNLTHNGSGYDVTQEYHFRTLVKYVPRIHSQVRIEFEVI